MKRFFLLLLLTIILIAANSIVFADQAPQQKIRIAAFNFYPTLYQDKDGSVKGFYVDFLDEIAKREGWKIEYVYGNWADGLTRIKTGEVDVLANVAFTNERTAFLDYGKEPLLTVWAELYVHTDSTIDSIMEVKGKKIALMKGDFNAANFKNLVEQFGISCQYVEYGNFEEVFKAIASKQVDGGVVNNTFGSAKYRDYDIKTTGVIFNPFDIYLAVAKGKNSTVLSTLDRYLVEWRKSESSPYHQARERWAHGTASTIRVTNPWVKKIIAISIAGLFVALAFIFMLRVQVRRKTFEIQSQLEERQKIEEALIFINESGAKTRGDELLGTITSYLGRTLGVEYAFVSQLLPGNTRAKTRGLFANGAMGEDIEYDLQGTPCENVIGKNLCLYPREVIKAFPSDDLLEKMGAEAYAASPLWDSQGAAIGLLGIVSKKPIENSKLVETIIQLVATRAAQELEAMSSLDELSQSRKLLANLANQVPGVVYQYRLYADGSSAFPYASQGMNDIYEMTPEEVQEDAAPVFSRLHPDDYDQVASAIQESARTLETFYCEFRVILPRQGLRWRWSQAQPERMPDGGTLWHGIISDITDRKQAEEKLIASERFLRMLTDQLPGMVGYWTDELCCRFANRAYLEWFGRTPEQMMGITLQELLGEELFQKNEPYIRSVLQGEPQHFERTLIKPNGETGYTWGHYIPDLVDDKVRGFYVLVNDVTALKLAEEEKNKLEGQLQQAQKMESVGRLAGGVAHDFNNLLTVITGYACLGMIETDQANPTHAKFEEISRAAEKSADLTRQLLAFARKQTIAPKVLDLNETVENMLNMLRRLIGENIHLAWLPAKNLWQVKFDPSQIDQILANLCVNSRDAIADVGKITIETGNSTFDKDYCDANYGFIQGEYLLLAVSDDGCGMDKETIAHIFEPFFTTKANGEGTGLGLATVYGIVKQNNGFINIYSEPGHGTTVKIYLPRFEGNEGREARIETTARPFSRGQETILLVEDEPGIRNMTTILLEMQGYKVFPASTPSEALKLAKEHTDQIHMLITDVVMPEMNGRDLAGKLLLICPNIKCLFMSGYTANVIAHHGVLDENINFISKPFSLSDLSAKVREVLDCRA